MKKIVIAVTLFLLLVINLGLIDLTKANFQPLGENLSGVPYQRYVVYNISETLSRLTVGNHSLTINATMFWGGRLSKDVGFTISEVTTPQYILFNLDALQVSLISVCFLTAVVGAGFFVYAKRRKRFGH